MSGDTLQRALNIMCWRFGKAIIPRWCLLVKNQYEFRVQKVSTAAAHYQLSSTITSTSAQNEESMDFPGGKVPFTTQVQSRPLQRCDQSGCIAETVLNAADNAWRTNLHCSSHGVLQDNRQFRSRHRRCRCSSPDQPRLSHQNVQHHDSPADC